MRWQQDWLCSCVLQHTWGPGALRLVELLLSVEVPVFRIFHILEQGAQLLAVVRLTTITLWRLVQVGLFSAGLLLWFSTYLIKGWVVHRRRGRRK